MKLHFLYSLHAFIVGGGASGRSRARRDLNVMLLLIVMLLFTSGVYQTGLMVQQVLTADTVPTSATTGDACTRAGDNTRRAGDYLIHLFAGHRNPGWRLQYGRTHAFPATPASAIRHSSGG